MRIAHITHSDLSGGAARAALRLHDAMVRQGMDSWMLVNQKSGDDKRVIQFRRTRSNSLLHRLLRRPLQKIENLHRRYHPVYSSFNWLPTGLIAALDELKPDVVHLHWLGENAASIEEIGATRFPVVWTLHDMWAFCGAKHYDPDLESSVWRRGVPSLSQVWRPREDAIEKLMWLRKRRSWRGLSLHLVGPSRWMTACAKGSALFFGREVTHIPYALDLEMFRPYNQKSVREIYGLPNARPIILFGADGGLADPRKGGNLLLDALRQLTKEVLNQQPLFCVFGQSVPEQVPFLPVEVRFLGRINDDLRLAMLYAAADVMVIPSRLESL